MNNSKEFSQGEIYEPSEETRRHAWVNNERIYEMAQDYLTLWDEVAKSDIEWFEPYEDVLDDSNAPFYRWYVGGKINITHNCLDRHIESKGDKTAIIWQGEPENEKERITYHELYRRVCRFANALRTLGVKEQDVVTIYMGMVPELLIAMLACARIGAIHNVVFGGFSSTALRDRINDANAKVVVTMDGYYRRGKVIETKRIVDKALEDCNVESVVVLERIGNDVSMVDGRDIWWHDLQKVPDKCECKALDSEHPLFILYTSGTTGKPKGVLHVHGGYNVGTHITTKWVFDLKDRDIFWCTADIGWITGHSYVVYGPLSNGATILIYEGAPDYPQPDRWWSIIEQYGVTVFYTAPTAIRYFMKLGEEWLEKHDLSSLRLLGTVGETIDPEAWKWYYKNVGNEHCPVIDTWWQTETGMVVIAPLPGVTKLKPGSVTLPFPGILVDIRDEKGNPADSGELVITNPWPAMFRNLWGEPERFAKQYWRSNDSGELIYYTGDGARKDGDGYYWIIGRIDEVLKVSGHRLGSAEIEGALISHEAVSEAAVIGKPHEIKGQVPVAFVVLKTGYEPSVELEKDLKTHVRNEIGAIAVPEEIYFVEQLPKTRSGKIVRRILLAIEKGEEIGDITTLEDITVVEKIKDVKGAK
ncbi:acetyl-coenzyme A synthetase [Archaeoglobus sulfaticallidus PM70-1]|uniref:Acetyl-coenzyme A synthetase n=1 Tax=Archaeoglobus sulfaticallidus PM70-1 TaxID=387631 RepID=N0BBD7_9EURY|nr:acetate--CoA ligase [Archaeoglobus sulfaticallidus]AGK60914.1 acetyl-coenzyme A synthetase [Archaeoglobus sulfaticallidus PM70-1]